MDLNCPYCNNELIEGFIRGGRYTFKWYTENMSFIAKHTEFGGEIISENPKVKCYRCKSCNKIIIDIDGL
ncbi:hypothetical protein SAMN05446037_10322 [Anaerovirgula multivorans]|uniref:DUF6487 domain-containing protein n=1 Tax=Anaerovirgula multivorans TaxID=312168 RepID=A0A239IZS0_9FIRM|nr:PF20097 family protein [Anaerovirgula multivorans]SNS99025.1 hypothetical protein SAMN05446037_10322 [Anaerovirgula multivorans]